MSHLAEALAQGTLLAQLTLPDEPTRMRPDEALWDTKLLLGVILDKPVAEGATTADLGPKNLPMVQAHDASGQALLAAFTEERELGAFYPQATGAILMPLRHALKQALAQGCTGLVINPASPHGCRLDAPLIQAWMSEGL